MKSNGTDCLVLLDEVYNHLPFGIRVVDNAYVIIDINQEFVDILSDLTNQHLTKEMVIGRKCYEIIGRTEPCTDCLLHSVLTTVSNIKERVKQFSILGGRTFKIYTQTIHGAAGEILGAIEWTAEITDRINFEELFNLLTDSVYIIDADTYRILAVNDAAATRLGYSREELLKLYLKDIDSCVGSLNYQDYQRLFERVHVDKYGRHIPVEINAQSISYMGKRAVLGVARDISGRKKIEELDKQLVRMDRMNLVGEMAASIGHEVRNPMTTVRGFLQLFKNKEEFKDFSGQLNIMIEELDRANEIISDFLSLAKKRVVELKEQDLNSIIHSLYPLIQANIIVHGHKVNFDLGTIPMIFLDEKDIRQLILNMIQNAIEAMVSAGTITIKTYVRDASPTLSIHDCGGGIPTEILEKIGTPFFTTKDNGTGLGLAVCYTIAQRHNAEITIETDYTGTTFYLTFNNRSLEHRSEIKHTITN